MNKHNRNVMNMLFRLLLVAMLAVLAGAASAVEKVTYYHNDVLGSPVAATDAQGSLLWEEAYDPYGKRLLKEDGGKEEVWFTGKQEESAFDVSYFGARWYDPSIGRFLAIDPAGVSSSNIHSFNRYTYVNNNPYKYVDPDGRIAVPLIIPFLPEIGAATYTLGKLTLVALLGISLSGDVAYNENANDAGANVDSEVGSLVDGLDHEQDSRGRDKPGNFVDPEGNAQDALDGLTGESDGNGGKVLPDGSRAGTHVSSGTTGGEAGANTGSPSLHINRPQGKKDIKIRYPNSD